MASNCTVTYLHISTLCNFCKVFLMFKGLIFLVICHTKYPESSLQNIYSFCKDHKPNTKTITIKNKMIDDSHIPSMYTLLSLIL